MRLRRRSSDAGFTLVELVVTITIMGVIIVPVSNFVLAYFKNLTSTQNRLADSHDVQIAAAYFSKDVANVGMHVSATDVTFVQSVFTSPTGTYCGSSLGGTTLLLLKWDDWTVSGGANPTGVSAGPHSAAYVVKSGRCTGFIALPAAQAPTPRSSTIWSIRTRRGETRHLSPVQHRVVQ